MNDIRGDPPPGSLHAIMVCFSTKGTGHMEWGVSRRNLGAPILLGATVFVGLVVLPALAFAEGARSAEGQVETLCPDRTPLVNFGGLALENFASVRKLRGRLSRRRRAGVAS